MKTRGQTSEQARRLDQQRATAAHWVQQRSAFGVALGPLAAGRVWRVLALTSLLAGTLLFAGSLVGNVFLQWPTALAPMGGTLMMAGWLAWAAAAVRQ